MRMNKWCISIIFFVLYSHEVSPTGKIPSPTVRPSHSLAPIESGIFDPISNESNISQLFGLGNKYHYANYCKDNAIPTYRCQLIALDYYLAYVAALDNELQRSLPINHGVLSIGQLLQGVNSPGTQYEGVLNDVGVLYLKLGRIDQAIQTFKRLLSINPLHINAIGNLASIYNTQGSYELARMMFERAIEIDPGNAHNYYNFGVLQHKLQNISYARYLWEKTVAISPSITSSYANLALLDCQLGNISKESKYYVDGINNAIQSNNTEGYYQLRFLQQTSSLPVIADDSDVVSMRSLFFEGIQSISSELQTELSISPYDLIGCSAMGYYAIYHGYEDFSIRSMYSYSLWKLANSHLDFTSNTLINQANGIDDEGIIEPIISIISSSLDQGEYKKARVGFLSSFWFHHSVGLLLRGVIKNIDRRYFDVFLLHVRVPQAMWAYDDLTRDLASSNLTYMSLSSSLASIQMQISSLNLDILVFGEVGMDSTTYFLSFSRLAKRSVVFWGHAVTSGVSVSLFRHLENQKHRSPFNMTSLCDPSDSVESNERVRDGGPDYFISSRLFEIERSNSQWEYAERLILMDSMTSFFYHPKSPLIDKKNLAMYVNDLISQPSSVSDCPNGFDPGQGESVQDVVSYLSSAFNDCNITSDERDCDGMRYLTSSPYYHQLLSLPSASQYLEYIITSDRSQDDLIYSKKSLEFIRQKRSNLTVYAVPQTLYKLRTDFDAVIFGILDRDVNSVILFPQGSDTLHVDLLRARWLRYRSRHINQSDGLCFELYRMYSTNRSAATDIAVENCPWMTRLIFLRPMNESEYLTYCAIADVVLDPWPVGGGRSSFEIFSVGTPIIVLISRAARTTTILQLTWAMYRVMGIGLDDINTDDCCVTNKLSKYIAMARLIANNKTLQYRIKRSILSYSWRLYENQTTIDEWNRMLLYVANNPRPVPQLVSFKSLKEYADPDDSIRRSMATVTIGQISKSIHEYGHDSCSYHLLSIYKSLLSNPSWLYSELVHATFTYISPATKLRDIVNETVLQSYIQSMKEFKMAEYPEYIDESEFVSPILPSNQYPASRKSETTPNESKLTYNEKFHVIGQSIPISLSILPEYQYAWIDDCISQFQELHGHIFLELFYGCIIAGRGLLRHLQPSIYQLEYLQPTSVPWLNIVYKFDVKRGDDMNQILTKLQSRHSLDDATISMISNQIATLEDSDPGSIDSVCIRRSVGMAFALRYLHTQNMIRNISSTGTDATVDSSSSRSNMTNDQEEKGLYERTEACQLPHVHSLNRKKRATITLGITTCKRLTVFQRTISALIEAFGPLPNSFITDVIIIDDNSSSHDRIEMMTSYPSFTFIFQSSEERGHSNSLNRLFRLVKTQYFLYLEDDWMILRHGMNQDIVSNDLYRLQVYSILIDSLSILGFHGDMHLPSLDTLDNITMSKVISIEESHDDNNISKREPVHQVLFNDQSSRPCAEGGDCDRSLLGQGGWPREVCKDYLHVHRKDDKDHQIRSSRCISYSLHEFGYISTASKTSSSIYPFNRIHDFTYWPGFSFNPGLWDMNSIRYYLKDDIDWKNGDMFVSDQSNLSFEQVYSILSYARGMNMAYLPIVMFKHIGEESAYDISNIRRQWTSESI